ncbi:hypothetical protein R8Z57_15345 [Microbacterium sp. M3]|uniref:Uncharacterized protein n=1 Tax=Microbacterium arthrosphaerae TaxID=792652 RepID=A0ABU4H686_9MICO|nr:MULTISPECIES: hypothetical protein [Microbacterium]MDW4574154.1 hypothetical protein [Microbacterium arthrosphaerae]MDW7608009.1 hypothetical protein [Microbacterium sp. M3]
MRTRLVAVLIAVTLALTGCAAAGPSSPATTPSMAASRATPTPTPAPTPAPLLTIGVEGLQLVTGGDTRTLAFDDPEAILAFIEDATGVPRAGEDFEDPWGNGDVWGTLFTWDDIRVSVLKDGPATVTLSGSTVGDIPVTTASGIAVGDSRDAVVAAGGWDEWDADGDGRADHLGIDGQDVAGTQSLTRPGSVGRMFVSVSLDGDIVTGLQSPSNDFSDL